MQPKVCSLELSKRLKELGCPQDSIWKWTPKEKIVCDRKNNGDTGMTVRIKIECAAYTCSELGERLPERYLSGRTDMGWNCWKFSEEWLIDNYNKFCTDTEANARAKMLIYLAENKLIDLNRRVE